MSASGDWEGEAQAPAAERGGLCTLAFRQGCWGPNWGQVLPYLPEVKPAEEGAACWGRGAEDEGWDETISLFAARTRANSKDLPEVWLLGRHSCQHAFLHPGCAGRCC